MILLLFTALFVDHNAAEKNRAKQIHPNNYLQKLPQFSLGYISELPIPSMNLPHLVKPTKVMKTKVFNMVTKYVYRSPVCVKISGKKSPCEKEAKDTNIEYTITKGYHVENRNKDDHNQDFPNSNEDHPFISPYENSLDLYVESSENSEPFSKQAHTPSLTRDEIKELLIEDRLDQLETILPHYTRRRLYETTTVTVTKVKNDNRVMATLLVKNCVPQGYPLCPPKSKKRKSKVARWTNTSSENYFG